MADPQKQQVYSWGAEIKERYGCALAGKRAERLIDTGNGYWRCAEAEALLAKASRYYGRQQPPALHIEPGWGPSEADSDTIWLSDARCNNVLLLHEFTHTIVPGYGHGPMFAKIYASLLIHYKVASRREVLALAQKHGVVIGR